MVHQPQVVLLSLLGCRSPEPPAPTVAPAPVEWRRVGLLSDQPGAPSLPFPGARALVETCQDRPCTAERWQSADGGHHDLLRDGRRLRWADAPDEKWTARWRRLNGVLALCVGDPLGSSPAGDPGLVRTLRAVAPPAADNAARWQLHFSGDNPCRLSGTLELSGRADRAWTRALTCDGLPWARGGAQRARELTGISAPPSE